MEFEQIDVRELLPQQPPFVMIDTLTWCDDTTTRTRLTVRRDNIFCDDDMFSAYGLTENIAQTCAARMGYFNTRVANCKVRLGFIGAVKGLEVMRQPKVGETLDTCVEVLQDVMQMTLVSAVVKVGDEVIVRAEMKIAMSD